MDHGHIDLALRAGGIMTLAIRDRDARHRAEMHWPQHEGIEDILGDPADTTEDALYNLDFELKCDLRRLLKLMGAGNPHDQPSAPSANSAVNLAEA